MVGYNSSFIAPPSKTIFFFFFIIFFFFNCLLRYVPIVSRRNEMSP